MNWMCSSNFTWKFINVFTYQLFKSSP